MATSKKVFDVAKPGSSAPEIGSKPMVAGHKMMKDPSITEKEDKNESTDEPIAQTSKIKIEPLSEQEKTSSSEENEPGQSEEPEDSKLTDENKSDDSDEKEDDSKTDEIAEDKSNIAPISNDNTTEEIADSEATSNEPEQSEADKAVEHEENLQKIIRDKTYNVHIEDASYSAFKTFIKTFIVVFLLGIIILFLLIDAEIIDLGIELPFNVL